MEESFSPAVPGKFTHANLLNFKYLFVKGKANKGFLGHRRVEWTFIDIGTDLTLTCISRVHVDNLLNCLSISFFSMKHIWWI